MSAGLVRVLIAASRFGATVDVIAAAAKLAAVMPPVSTECTSTPPAVIVIVPPIRVMSVPVSLLIDATSAETLRAQVEATRAQTAIALEAALQPLKIDVADLRRVQYEQQGQRAAVVDTTAERRASIGQIAAVAAVIAVYLTAVIGVAALIIHG